MKRKYFSALLMGALTIASVSTFTSCKDYDDDISSLQSQIDKLNEMVSQIQGQIDNGAILTGVNPVENGVKLTLSNGKEYTITNGKDADVWKIDDDGYWYKNDTKTNYKAKGDKGENGTNGKYYVPNPATGCFDIYQDGKKVESTQIAYTSTKENIITATWEKDVLTLLGVKDATDGKVTISLTTDLKALVFSPEFYYEGIEAFDFATFKYQPKKVEAVDANGDYKDDAPTNVGSLFTYAPDLSVDYFLNPANAKMDAEASKYSFIVADKKYTRAEAIHNITVKSADLESNKGMVTVKAKYDGDAIKKIATDKQVTVAALQYAGENGTVTSDFAAITASEYTDFALNNPKAETKGHDAGASHLYTTAASAIAAEASITIAWNNAGIDLREYVNTDRKYSETENTPCTAWDENAKEGKVEKDGFKYSFELVGYHTGDNVTSQSAHAAIAEDGYTLRPQMPKDGKQQKYGFEQNEAEIGREPLVRVTLTDGVNNKIVAVGYIKIAIAATDKKEDALEVGMKKVETNYAVACGSDEIAVQKLKWHDIEEQVMAAVHMSRTEFDNTYEIDGTTANAAQFSEATLQAEALAADKKIGTISQTTGDDASTETEVLKWAVPNNQAYTLFKAGKSPLTTYIRFKLKANATAANKFIYVKFTWEPAKTYLEPSTSFSNDNKIKKYWYAANDKEAGSGYVDIHGNVEVVGTTGANDEYVFDMKNALVGNKLSVSDLIDAKDETYKYADFGNNLSLKFRFVSTDKLFADENGEKIYADKTLADNQLVASMDKTTGVVTYATTDVAKKLLNAYSHHDLVNTVTARVAVEANVCTNINVPVKNNEFNVKFLRPITIEGASASFEDAETNGSVSKIKLTFIDWREHNFTNTNQTKGVDYFKYYGVKEINVDTDAAKSDINGNDKQLLSDITSKVKFSFIAPDNNGTQIAAGQYGQLKYENNGLTVGQFNVYFPAKITYDWGTIDVTIKATVGKTQNNARRH